MPITFEQPAPLAPEVSANAGRAEIMTRDYPTLASLYHAGMQARSQAQIAQAQINQQGAIAQANRTQQGIESEAQLAQQASQFQQQRQPSQRDVFEAQQQQQLQQQSVQQQAELRAWLNQQELSQQERMDLSRMKNGLGYIEQQRAAGVITDKDASDMSMQLVTRINPLNQRLQQEQMKRIQEQGELYKQEAMQKTVAAQTQSAFMAKTFDQRVGSWKDPDTGETHAFFESQAGKWEPIKQPGDPAAHQPIKWSEALKVAEADALRAVPEYDPHYKALGSAARTDEQKAEDKAQADAKAKYLDAEREALRRQVYDHNDHARNPVLRYDLEPASVKNQFQTTYGDQAEAAWKQQHAATLQSARGGRNAPPPMQAPGAAPQQGAGAAPQPIQQPPAGTPPKPFDLSAIETAAPVQRQQLGDLAKLRANVSRPDLSAEEQQKISTAADGTAALLAKYGSFADMKSWPKEDAERAAEYRKTLKDIPKPRRLYRKANWLERAGGLMDATPFRMSEEVQRGMESRPDDLAQRLASGEYFYQTPRE